MFGALVNEGIQSICHRLRLCDFVFVSLWFRVRGNVIDEVGVNDTS